MGQRAVVLAELAGAQGQHVFDALDLGRAHVAGKLLIAKHGQPFFQAKLEPVAAGDAVAGPVVEVFMRDDRLDPGKVIVGCGFGQGQDISGVEDVQPLVFHGPHVEIIDGDDVEDIQIIFAAIGGFVPAHGALQRIHGIGAFARVAGAHPDVQGDLAPRGGDKRPRMRHQIARNQREQIGGLGPGIVPFRPARPLRHRIAVRQQHRQIAFDAHAERGHDIGAVGIEGDPAESFRLALRAKHAVRHVEPFQRGIGLWRNLDFGFQPERALRQQTGRNGKAGGIRLDRQRGTVQRYRHQSQHLPVQPQIVSARPRGVRGQIKPRGHPRCRGMQPERQPGARDKVWICSVIRQVNGFGHRCLPSLTP